MKGFLLLCLVLFFRSAFADTFVVTTNANDGAGSLREAIIQANSNGTASQDFIVFNIPANAPADVTIALTEALPNLTSNIVIDATTQPTQLLNSASVRINLIQGNNTTFYSGFRIVDEEKIEIYGFNFLGFKSAADADSENQHGGIFLLSVKNIIIGSPGKGNSFGNNFAGILSPYVSKSEKPEIDQITIASNIFGMDPQGLTPVPNQSGINISFLKNSTIGGPTPAHGNLISGNTDSGIALGDARSSIVVQHNVIGLNITQTKSIGSFGTKGSLVRGMEINGQQAVASISDNVIGNQDIGIYINEISRGKFTLSNNYIGVRADGVSESPNKVGIHIKNSKAGTILENKIAYNELGVKIEISYPISVLKNSFYCNTQAIEFSKIDPGEETQSRISTISATKATGVFLPNSTVELFYLDSCGGCQGKTWLATLQANASGYWEYNGPITGPITSMGTNEDGATITTFSKPFQNTAVSPAIAGVYCGLSNGSITGLEIFDASVFEWYNANGDRVGSEKDLTNAPAGAYYLTYGQRGACDLKTQTYTVPSSPNGVNDTNVQIVDASCGQSNGSIKQIVVTNNPKRTWYNAAGEIVGNDNDLIGVPAGKYHFTAGATPCDIVSITYEIKDIQTKFVPSVVSILPATCATENGSIKVSGWGSQEPDSVRWTNTNGLYISSSYEIKGLKPGKYILTAFGNSGCNNIAGEFEVPDVALPQIDASSLVVELNCAATALFVRGIQVKGTTGPYSYTWLDDKNQIAYHELQPANMLPGNYYLVVKDINNCEVRSPLFDFTQSVAAAVKIPSAFSPNGDGVNDTWKISGLTGYPFANITVFNRLGTRVFTSKGYGTPFTGAYKNKALPVGVYFYVIELNGACPPLKGSVTIIR